MREIKRVLHVVSTMDRCGAETMIMNIYRNLDREKIQFDFVCHQDKKCDYEDEILSMGGRIFKIKSLGTSGMINYINNLKKVMVENGPYWVVHGHTDIQTGIVALAAKLAGVKKRICHSHSTNIQMEDSLKTKVLYTMLRSFILIFATDLCACSKAAGEFLFGKKKADEVKIINNGILLGKFINCNESKIKELRKELTNGDENQVLIGHIGRFFQVKNHKFMVLIAEFLQKKNFNFKFVFVGDGPLLKEIAELIKEKGLTHRFELLGVRSDIPEILGALDMLIMPSIYEGIPLTLIEAQASGRTCLISDTIDSQSDLGLGLIKQLSLSKGIEKWYEAIEGILKADKGVDKKFIEEKIKAEGYDIIENMNEIYKIYNCN